ncbi:unnamed protein product [Macrosiphum euphorbiae]|uniref:Regulatory protein zeste n=1 Tax=Macrosiphum euphorbiae TaxID=13131 RepID=A0AAV0WBN5_9HEMI|nr:unnamed protein product [Macrosiphum euphorbiae]CAI6363184.1 unnamed protein product [Macrosiphum euphorbiae]
MEDSMCEVKKRQRGKNFTEREKEYLIDLILPYKSIIENVKTDAVWNNKKMRHGQKLLMPTMQFKRLVLEI